MVDTLGGRPLTTAHVVADHAAMIWQKRVGDMRVTALRSKSPGAREILAHAATSGVLDAAGLVALGTAATTDLEAARAQVPVDAIRWDAWAAFAYVLAVQLGLPQEQLAARGLYDLHTAIHGNAGLQPHDITTWAQLLAVQSVADPSLVERAREALTRRKCPAEVVTLTEADLIHPRLHPSRDLGPVEAEQRWITDLSAALVAPGRVGLRLEPGDAPALDRLHAMAAPRIEDGPMITVVMSAYNPDEDALAAARSIVEQTWQRWELLVVDDRSPNPQPGIWEALEALDPRIRVIHKRTNGGTYSCRNVALTQARGDYLTCLDSDDWAHPQRLELGVAPMVHEPSILATRAKGVRTTSDLVVTRVGYPGRFDAASSLMFRMHPVFTRLGFFDTVRKGADTEYARRIEASFGTTVHDVGPDVLTILRSSDASLSADDFSRGWRHESRAAYKQAYAAWHESFALGVSPYLDPAEPRPFVAPRRWSAARATSTPHLDLVLGGDWRRFGGPQASMLEEIAAATEAGWTVGVMHLEAMRFNSRTDDPLCDPVRALIDAGQVERVYPDDVLDIDVLLVRYPPVLQFPPVFRRTVDARHVLVMANQAPAEVDGSDQRYVPADVSANVRALFGVEPVWVPQGPSVRALLEAHLPAGEVATWDNPGRIDQSVWRVRSDRPVAARPVVGRYSRDNRIKFPATGEDLLAAYALDPARYDVRMMGAKSTCRALLAAMDPPREFPPNWEFLPHKGIPVLEFLAGLDVVVYMDNREGHEAFGRVLLESAASGVPVIADRKHEATFGDALLYAEPAEVPALVDRLCSDPVWYRERVATADRVVQERFSRAGFVADLRPYLGRPLLGRPLLGRPFLSGA